MAIEKLIPRLDDLERSEKGGYIVRSPHGAWTVEVDDSTPTRRVAAIVVLGRALRHDIWRGKGELTDADFEQLLKQPPEPEMQERSYRFLDPKVRPRQGRCSSCQVTPGRNFCGVCRGLGYVRSTDSEASGSCPGCGGEGFLVCSTCDGSTSTWHVSLVYSTDVIVDFKEIILPSLAEPLRQSVRSALSEVPVPPSVLRFEWDQLQAASPYRQRRATSFHGFDLSEAQPVAERFSARLSKLPSIGMFGILTYAWPLLVLQIPPRPREAVLLVHQEGLRGIGFGGALQSA